MTKEEHELAEVRKEIDALDYIIHDLINDRAKLALNVAKIKIKYHPENVTFYRPEREKLIIQQIKDHNLGPLDEFAIARIFELIIKECRDLQINMHKGQKS